MGIKKGAIELLGISGISLGIYMFKDKIYDLSSQFLREITNGGNYLSSNIDRMNISKYGASSSQAINYYMEKIMPINNKFVTNIGTSLLFIVGIPLGLSILAYLISRKLE
jgi:hypothetical protein